VRLVGGMAPIDPHRHPEAQRFYLEGVTAQTFDERFDWNTTGEFLGRLERDGVALNVALLCPHGLIQLQAMGPRRDHADEPAGCELYCRR